MIGTVNRGHQLDLVNNGSWTVLLSNDVGGAWEHKHRSTTV